MRKLLMTGHLGLVGRYLKPRLEEFGFQVVGFDLANGSGDITLEHQLQQAVSDCHGIVHLASVSRVVWGEEDPHKCWRTNALASESLLKFAAQSMMSPWVLVASSREVYGESALLPVQEDVPLKPVNIYGRAKLYMEQAAMNVREQGVNTAIVRFANVYGCVNDHHDRVLPAFCRNAVLNQPLRVDGFDHLFDFTHVNDTVTGVTRLVEMLDSGERNIPPIHLLPGIGTTLKQAAERAVAAIGSKSVINESSSRQYDVGRFIGDPQRAKALLGWQAKIHPEQGIPMLVNAFKNNLKVGVCA